MLVCSLAGCTIGTDYVRPDLQLPQTWRMTDVEAQTLSNAAWWRGFDDPELNRLVDQALQYNKDLLVAAARIEEFYARVGAARSALFPQLDTLLNAQRTGRSGNLLSQAGSQTFNDFQASLGLSWELDVWGRVRRLTEAARASLLAEEATRRAIVLTVVSSVATAYTDLRSLDRRLEIARETLVTRERSFQLAKSRFTSGLTSELEMRQAEAEVLSTQVQIPTLEQTIFEAENAISVLVGDYPRRITRGRPIQELVLAGGIPAGLPCDLVSQRPDLIAAEQNLAAANALVGVAQTEWYPRISLTSLLGFESQELSDLISSSSKAWSVAGAAAQPIFSGGRISSDIQTAEAEREQAQVSFLQAVTVALQEVEDTLIANRKSAETTALRTRQVEVLQRYLTLARSNYDAGQISYLEVLDAERNLFDSEVALAEAQAARTKAQIALYRALGGGWVSTASDAAVGTEMSAQVPAP